MSGHPLATAMLKLAHVFLGDVMTPYYTIASRIILSRLLNWLFSSRGCQITIKVARMDRVFYLESKPPHETHSAGGSGSIKGTPTCLPASYWWRLVSGNHRRAASGNHDDFS